MLERPRINSCNAKAINAATDPTQRKQREHFSQTTVGARESGIDRWYREGGYWYVQWVKKNYRRHTGEPLRWDEPFLEEFMLLFGTPWVERIVCAKPSQVGYTELSIALIAFCLAAVRVSVGFGVEQASKLRDIVAPRIQPSFDACEPVQRLKRERKKATDREDADTKDRVISVGGVNLTCFYVTQTAASTTTSFEAWVIIADEIERYKKGALGTLEARQEACQMPTRPFRAGSTPGKEGGQTDLLVKRSAYCFEWHVSCPCCNKLQSLDPFGNLLLPTFIKEGDTKEERFIDVAGRPLNWFSKLHSDVTVEELGTEELNEKIQTAYVGCRHCGGELTTEAIREGSYLCLHTGYKLKDFIRDVVADRIYITDQVAITIPRIASVLFKAPHRIRKLLKTDNPEEEFQQGFGKSVSIGGGKISLIKLMEAVGKPLPLVIASRKPDLVIMGCDQGKGIHHIVVQHWYYAEEKDPFKAWKFAHKKIVHYAEVPFGEPASFDPLDNYVRRFNVDWLGMDADPEHGLANNYARDRQPFQVKLGQTVLFDQVVLVGQDYRAVGAGAVTKKRKKNQPPKDAPILYRVNRTSFLDPIRDRLYWGTTHLPPGLFLDHSDPHNYLLHYITSDRLSNGIWESEGRVDHYFHADSFGEAIARIHFYIPRPRQLSFTSFSPTDSAGGKS
jgi:hypothetical protein